MSTRFVDEAEDVLVGMGYSDKDIVRNCTFTTRDSEGRLIDQRIDLVAFSRQPYDTQNACIAAFESSPVQSQLLDDLRFLTAPLAIVGHQNKIEFWSVRKNQQQQPFDVFDRAEWPQRMRSRVSEYSPEAIIRAKEDRIQLSFVDSGLAPWVHAITTASLNELLGSLIHDCIQKLPSSVRQNEEARSAIIRLVFNLFACCVLEDKGIVDQTDTPQAALQQAGERFSENITIEVLDSQYVTQELARMVFSRLRNDFSFSTLTTDVLAYSYENTLVTKVSRHNLGIYYTPPEVTEYILNRLPIESIPQNDRVLWDPCCGCGSFLRAAFHRLSSLLPDTFSSREKHRYLRTRIIGSDIDPFAKELASLALVLTDVYNENGWKVFPLDAITASKSDLPRTPNIITTNLPFREIKLGTGTRTELSAEIFKTLVSLAPGGALFGVIVPQSFLDSKAATSARRLILDSCDVLEIDLFPGALYKSFAETAVLLLRKRLSNERGVRITTVRELRSADFEGFLRSGSFTRTYPVEPQKWEADEKRRMFVSPLAETWEKLEAECPRLREISEIRNGLQIKKDDQTSVSEKRRPGDKPYVDRLDVLRPFALLTDADVVPTKWIKYGDQLHRARDPGIFRGERILINSNRNPGSAWRIVAGICRKELYFKDNFHAIIPLNFISVEELVAVLNSPVANGWFDNHCRRRKVVQEILAELPVPRFEPRIGQRLKAAVKDMEHAVIAKWRKATEGLFYDGPVDTSSTVQRLAEIDELVYDAYGLSQYERKQISNLMSTDNRPS